jgi:acyl-CoA thioester hydrolase
MVPGMTAELRANTAQGHLVPMSVHYDDLDQMGMVHNARYALMLERALNTYWVARNYAYVNGVYTHPDAFIAVAEFTITYRVPVRGIGDIGVQFWVDKFGDSSVVYAYRVLSADGSTVHAEGRRVHIRLDPKTLRPTAWGEDTRAIYESLSK